MDALKVIPALFLQTVFVLGTIKSFGVFLPELKSELEITSTDIGISLGLFQGLHFGLAPLSTYIYQKSNNTYRRLLLISGAALSSGGFLMGATINNNVQLALYLTISGAGANMVSSVLVITLSAQSGDDFKLFYGLGKSGFAFGMALVPLLTHYLMTIYGWRGSLIIVGGIMTHLIPLSMVVEIKNGSDEGETGNNTRSPENCEFLPRKFTEQRDATLRNEKRSFHIMKRVLRAITESVFYQDIWLTALIIATGAIGMVDGAWHAFLIPRAMSRGVPTSRALILAFSAGGGCFIARCLSGAIPHTKYLSGHDWFLILTVINCVSLLVDILLLDFRVMIITSFVSAMCIAELDILQVTLSKEKCSNESFPLVFAVGEIMFGSTELLGTSVSGFLADIFTDFNASFIFIVVVEACIFTWMVILRFTKRPPK